MVDTKTETETETIELTNALFQCLLNMTAGDKGSHRHLVHALHTVRWNMGNRWVIEMTEGDVKTARSLILDYTRNHRTGAMRTRFHNYMCQQSEAYRRLFWSEGAA